MNYRHHFHAGNFADLFKHAGLLAALTVLTAKGQPRLSVIDTHAGAGLYDLEGEAAQRSGEAAQGVGRLMADAAAPQAFAALKAAVRRRNTDGSLRYYPGSPLLTAEALRPGDRLCAFEWRSEDARVLQAALGKAASNCEVVAGDGFAGAPARLRAGDAALVLIDPPFERGDDYERIVDCVGQVLTRAPAASVMIWTPLKDLETFDRLLRRLEGLDPPPALVGEARLRPLSQPMRMNGCALITINPPERLEPALRACGDWIVRVLGEAGGEARLWTL